MPKVNSKLKTQNSEVQLKSQQLEDKKTVRKTGKSRDVDLSVPIYSLDGKEGGTLELPKSLFGQNINDKLLAQAARIYLNNQKGHFSHTKTRSEVKGSTRKIWRQKGTGRARHGSITAPIFVGGGIALGPKFRKVVLDLPRKMKRAALISALSSKIKDREVIGAAGLDKASGKTSQMDSFFKKLDKKSALLVVEGKTDLAERAVRNLPGVGVAKADQINILDIIKYQTLILTKQAVEKLESRVKSPESSQKKEKKIEKKEEKA